MPTSDFTATLCLAKWASAWSTNSLVEHSSRWLIYA